VEAESDAREAYSTMEKWRRKYEEATEGDDYRQKYKQQQQEIEAYVQKMANEVCTQT